MAFNGSGTFNRLYDWTDDAAANIKISSTRMDAEDDGFATGLTNCMTRDGQSPATANIPLGGNKLTGVAAGTAATDAATIGGTETLSNKALVNPGIGAQPNAGWGATIDFIEIDGLGAISKVGTSTFITHNAYYDDSNWKYIANGTATALEISGTAFTFYAAVSGSADGTITWLEERGTITSNSYISGLLCTNDTDTDHDINIAAGECMDSANAYLLKLSSEITKQIDAAWAAGDDQGGLFSGSVAADTTYHVFLIRKDSDGSIDAGFDTSESAANIPSGYTAYRKIFTLETDSSSNILSMTTSILAGNIINVDYNIPISDLDTVASGTTRQLLTVSIPSATTTINGKFSIHYNNSTGAIGWVAPTTMTDAAPSSANFSFLVNANGQVASVSKIITVDNSSQIAYRTSVSATLKISTIGYIYRR